MDICNQQQYNQAAYYVHSQIFIDHRLDFGLLHSGRNEAYNGRKELLLVSVIMGLLEIRISLLRVEDCCYHEEAKTRNTGDNSNDMERRPAIARPLPIDW